MMKSRFAVMMTVVLSIMFFGSLCYAQDNGPDQNRGPERGHRMRMDPQTMYTFQLMQMTSGIPELIKDKDHTLTPAQAKQILAVLKPLRNQAKLTPAQAKVAAGKLDKVFTKAQIEIMAQMRERRRAHRNRPNMNNGERGPGGPDGNRENGEPRLHRQGPNGIGPGGPGGPGGPRGRHMDPNAMKNWNPFYAKAAPGPAKAGQGRFGRDMGKLMETMFKDLSNRANGK